MSDFYLVQRLTRRDREGAEGFDARFECRYMDSAEEFGATQDAFKALIEEGVDFHIGGVCRKGNSRTVYVIGNPTAVDTIPDRLIHWMEDEKAWSKEMTYFPEHVDGTQKVWQDVDAWWALAEKVIWTLDPEVFETLQDVLMKFSRTGWIGKHFDKSPSSLEETL